jgi:CheY-like chemotaxis protein
MRDAGTVGPPAGKTFPVSPTPMEVGPCDPRAMAHSILIVDDDAAFRDLASRVVTAWGHNVVGLAGSVAEALTRAEEFRPDTALVDIGLPDGDGFALTEHLVALPWPMRVVLISSDSDASNATAAKRAGAWGFVPKDELSNAELRRWIERG